jgi:hypothetical protein
MIVTGGRPGRDLRARPRSNAGLVSAVRRALALATRTRGLRCDARRACSGESLCADSCDSHADRTIRSSRRAVGPQFFFTSNRMRPIVPGERRCLHVRRACEGALGCMPVSIDDLKTLVASVFSRGRADSCGGARRRAGTWRRACSIRVCERNIWCRQRHERTSSSENAGFFVAL